MLYLSLWQLGLFFFLLHHFYIDSWVKYLVKIVFKNTFFKFCSLTIDDINFQCIDFMCHLRLPWLVALYSCIDHMDFDSLMNWLDVFLKRIWSVCLVVTLITWIFNTLMNWHFVLLNGTSFRKFQITLITLILHSFMYW